MRASDIETISSLNEQLEAANDALKGSWAETRRLINLTDRLRDNADIKNRAIKYAFRAFWFIPIIAWLVILAVMWGEICAWGTCRIFKLPDLALVALITGPFVVMITILGMVLKGVFNAKIDDESPAGQFIDWAKKLGDKT